MSKKTALYQQHLDLKGKMIEFAGYQMPVQYELGIKEEHLWTRKNVGIFDVSHMGQAYIEGTNSLELEEFFNKITPSSFSNLPDNKAKYTVLTNHDGGIVDDLIITKINPNKFFIVFNAACKEKDLNWFRNNLTSGLVLSELNHRSLIAVQGPKSCDILKKIFINIDLDNQKYMTCQFAKYSNSDIIVSRLGYTGEDGFEISIENNLASQLWDKLTSYSEVKPIGLGARDTLRMEMGYPLYGHDINDTTSPVEANLNWIIRKNNPNYNGSDTVIKHLSNKPQRIRVGIQLLDRGIIREHTKIFDKNHNEIGIITSGGFGPSVNSTIAQGYVTSTYSQNGTELLVSIRDRFIAAKVVALSFIKATTK